MTTSYIEVTQQDINDGVPGQACSCPVAKAISRELGIKIPQDVIVGPDALSVWLRVDYWNNNYKQYETVLPHKVRKFIKHFDESKPVEPFHFTLKWDE